ncbi:MAG: diguanylate cyclase [Pseudomonadota bacterium]
MWLIFAMQAGVAFCAESAGAGVAVDIEERQLAKRTLTLGVFNYLGDEQTYAKYAPIVDYLNRTLVEERIRLEVLSHDEMNQRIAEGALDLATTNPTHFLHLRKLGCVDGVIASLVNEHGGLYIPYLAGIIIVLNPREDIKTLNDVRGKRIATPGTHLLGGYQTQVFELAQAGVQIPRDIAALRVVDTHQGVVRAVLDGSVDVGFLRSGILEMMEDAGELLPGDFRVINAQTADNFPYRHSTRLYPEWPVFSMPHVNEHAVRHFASALFALEADDPAAKQAGIYGYSVPRDYIQVEELSRTLRLPPFEKAPAFTLRDVAVRWKYPVLAALLAAILIAFLSLRLWVVWRRERQARQFNQLVLSSLAQGVYQIDTLGLCRFINPSALNILRIKAQDALGRSPHLLFHHHDARGAAYPSEECPSSKTLVDGLVRRNEEWFIRSDGELFLTDMLVAPMLDGRNIVGAVVIFEDISERKKLEQQLLELATTDALTGLHNRRYFLSRLTEGVARVRRFAEHVCVIMLDCDHFKQVNDSHGHAVGDEVLQGVADILRQNMRQTDVIGRLGGEEFAVLLNDACLESALEWTERVRTLVAAREYLAGDERFVVTISLGCTALRADDDENSVLVRADQALYLAKQNGRNRVESL